MAIDKDKIIADSIVGLVVGVGTTIVAFVPVVIYYGVSNWWSNRKLKKQISKNLAEVNRENTIKDVVDKMDQYSVIEFKVGNKS